MRAIINMRSANLTAMKREEVQVTSSKRKTATGTAQTNKSNRNMKQVGRFNDWTFGKLDVSNFGCQEEPGVVTQQSRGIKHGSHCSAKQVDQVEEKKQGF